MAISPKKVIQSFPKNEVSKRGVNDRDLKIPIENPPKIFNHQKNRVFYGNDSIKLTQTFTKPLSQTLFTEPERDFLSSDSQNQTNKILEEVLKNQNLLFEKLNLKSDDAVKKSKKFDNLTKEEEDEMRLKLIEELFTLDPGYSCEVDKMAIKYLDQIVTVKRKMYNKNKGKWYIEIGLQILFWGMEKALLRFNINAEGFCSFQSKHINKYESLINELCEIYFSEETGELKLSPEQRFGLFIIFQFLLFIGYKHLGNNVMVKQFLEYADNSVSNTLTNAGAGNTNNTQPSTGGIGEIFSGIFNTFTNNSLKNVDVGMNTPVMKTVSPQSTKRSSPTVRNAVKK